MLGQYHLSHPRERSGLPRRPRDAAAIRALPGAAGTRDGADRWQRGARRSPPGAGPALAEGSATRLETHFLEAGGDDDTPPCFQKNQKEEQTHHARSTHSRHSAHASGVGKLGGAGNRQGTPKSPPAPCITRPDRPFAASGLRVINRETSVPPLRTARTPPRPLSSSAGRLPRALQPAPRPPPPPQRIGAARRRPSLTSPQRRSARSRRGSRCTAPLSRERGGARRL